MSGRELLPLERGLDMRLLLPGGWEAFALPRTELAALEACFGPGAGPWIGQVEGDFMSPSFLNPTRRVSDDPRTGRRRYVRRR